MFEEATLGVELGEFSFDDLFEDVGRLAGTFHLLAEDVLFGLDEVGGDVLAVESGWSGGCDVKGEVLDDITEGIALSGVGLVGTDFDEDADLATHVDVGRDGTFTIDGEAFDATQLEVFAHLEDLGFDELVEGAFSLGKGEGFFGVAGIAGGDGVEDVLYEGLEVVVFGDEVGLAVDFDEDAGLGGFIDVSGDDAFLGFAVCLLHCFGLAFFAEELDGCFEVAVGFLEGVLALHHAHTGGFTEFFNERCGNHKSFLQSRV